MRCPKCNHLASYNSYFKAYYCSMCGDYFHEQYKGSTEELIDKLKKFGEVNRDGKMGDSCVVPKKILLEAAHRLEKFIE